jgi:NAD(P)-dependent dehydrogenase (short-subunit alcohol dehydrogenase family)
MSHLSRHATSGLSLLGHTAVVGGGTSGIGEALALRLAKLGANIHILGRNKSHGAAVLEQLCALNPSGRHEYHCVDAFSIPAVAAFGQGFVAAHSTLDILAMSQGMATLQGFTPTPDGLDQKLTLHYYSRVALAHSLLPALRRGTHPLVLSVLSGGVHAGVADWAKDPTLKSTYSLPRAANMAGFYNDLGLDALSRLPGNEGVRFTHAAPGFVSTRWGTEMPYLVRMVVRGLQVFGKSPADCAEAMLHPLFVQAGEGEGGRKWGGFSVIGEDGLETKRTALHTEDNVKGVWEHTVQTLKHVGGWGS